VFADGTRADGPFLPGSFRFQTTIPVRAQPVDHASGRPHEGTAGRTQSHGPPLNPWLNQPTLRMDTVGAVGRVAAIFTPITSSMIAKGFPFKST